MMPQKKKSTATSATSARLKRYGTANQMAHEQEGSIRRKALLKTLKESHDKGRSIGKQRAANKKKETGANSGTYGGGRSGLMSFFSGR